MRLGRVLFMIRPRELAFLRVDFLPLSSSAEVHSALSTTWQLEEAGRGEVQRSV
jgi:hypothetical protein